MLRYARPKEDIHFQKFDYDNNTQKSEIRMKHKY